jgi:DHA1 family tetracycline resistance protein-like MFS transporter
MNLDRRLYLIAAIVFTNLLGAGVILPILPLYAEGQFGATEAQAILLTSAYFAAQFVAAPILGRWADRIGRRPVLIVSQIGTVFSFVLFIFAGPLGLLLDEAIPPVLRVLGMSGGVGMLYVARILDGATGGNITVAQAYVSDVSSDKDRAQALGLISAAFGAGFVFGPAFGGVLATLSPTAPFVGAAIITAGTATLTAIILPESLPPEARATAADRAAGSTRMSPAAIIAQPPLLVIFVIGFLETLSFSAIPPTFALYADRVLFPGIPGDIVSRNVGLMLAFLGMAQVVTQVFFLKPLVDRYRERNLVLLSQVILASLFFLTPLTANPWVVMLGFAPFAFARGLTQPSEQALVTRFGTPQNRGQLLGTFQSVLSLAFIFGPVWSGVVFQNLSPRAVWQVGALILLPAMVLSLVLRRMTVPEPSDEQPS